MVVCIYPIAPGLLVLGGGFEEVEGQPRGSICMIDTLGNLVDAYFNGAGCGMYDYFTTTYGAIYGMTQAPDGDYYIWGAYHGYTDGTTNDTLQRMVTRLHGGEIGLGVPSTALQQEQSIRLYPNPASTSVTVELAAVPAGAEIAMFDALGHAVLRRRLNTYATLLDLGGLGVGIYALEYSTQGAQQSVQRLVV